MVSAEYSNLLDRLKEQLPVLNDEPHWLRMFSMRNGRTHAAGEALLDNRYWPDGQQIVDTWDWPESDFRVRHFLMLMPSAPNDIRK